MSYLGGPKAAGAAGVGAPWTTTAAAAEAARPAARVGAGSAARGPAEGGATTAGEGRKATHEACG